MADVRFDRRWLERLGQIATGVRWAGWILGAVLLIASVLTVATVVRLALHARRDEVDIMQLMGAPIGLLRGPLVVEGILQGGAGRDVACSRSTGGTRSSVAASSRSSARRLTPPPSASSRRGWRRWWW